MRRRVVLLVAAQALLVATLAILGWSDSAGQRRTGVLAAAGAFGLVGVGWMYLEVRRASVQHAARLGFDRLMMAWSHTTGLQGFTSALAQAAAEARTLVGGTSAVCCAADRTGVWRGRLVDDRGVHPVPRATLDAVISLVGASSGRELAAKQIAPGCRAALPDCGTVVVAGSASGEGSAGALAVAVFGDMGTGIGTEMRAEMRADTGHARRGDDQPEARATLLRAFVLHASLTTTNALLFERVEEALRNQLDLNRQKDEFVAAVSHELRTPLASMLGSVQTMRHQNERLDAPARERLLNIARHQGHRLQRLIEELLLTAAVEQCNEPVALEEVDLRVLLGEVADGLAEEADGRIEVRVDENLRTIRTDPAKLYHVVANLVENAVKYAPVGSIEIRAASGTIGDAEQVLIRVVDHGPGITPADRARAFEHFVQLDGSSTRARGGTGLGLYLSAQVTDLLGANLRVGETPGGGATFALSLPVDRDGRAIGPVSSVTGG